MKLAAVSLSTFLLGLLALTAPSEEKVASQKSENNPDRLIIAAARNVATMHRVTAKPFKMDFLSSLLCRAPAPDEVSPGDPHGEYYCHVFVDEAGLSPMQTGEGTYPVGSVIVKQKFSDAKAKATELYTLMRKMAPGYDPNHGDWEYSLVNRKATRVLARGRLESCIDCHQAYRETDHVTRHYMSEQPAVDPESK